MRYVTFWGFQEITLYGLFGVYLSIENSYNCWSIGLIQVELPFHWHKWLNKLHKNTVNETSYMRMKSNDALCCALWVSDVFELLLFFFLSSNAQLHVVSLLSCRVWVFFFYLLLFHFRRQSAPLEGNERPRASFSPQCAVSESSMVPWSLIRVSAPFPEDDDDAVGGHCSYRRVNDVFKAPWSYHLYMYWA